MSAYGSKVVAVLDTQSAFGVTIKQLRDNVQTLQAGQVAVSVIQPQNQLKVNCGSIKLVYNLKSTSPDGNSSQWVEI